MRRRQFIGLIGGAAAWPLAARGQQKARYPTIVLVGAGLTIGEETRRAFEAACSEFGWVEGRNIHIVYRWAQPSQMRAVVAELVSSAPVLIVALGTFSPECRAGGDEFDSGGFCGDFRSGRCRHRREPCPTGR